MARFFKPSRLLAVALVIGAGAWIASGVLSPHAEPEAAATTPAGPAEAAPTPVQKVSVAMATPEEHERKIVLSCVTQADLRSSAVARGAGIIVELKVHRGSAVRAGDVVAVISDEGRESSVKQAAVAAAEAALAAAQAEVDKSQIRSPVDGIVDSVPVQVGQAISQGMEVALVVGPDPMLAIGAVSERQRGHLVIGQNATMRFIDGSTFNGTVSFIGLSSDKATRTYRVEARMANPDAAIADGVTCEMAVSLPPVDATAIPRSALVFSDEGKLGVRVVDKDNKVAFLEVALVDDGRQDVWVTGIEEPARVIVVGQDFVKEGDPVEAVAAASIETKAGPPA